MKYVTIFVFIKASNFLKVPHAQKYNYFMLN